MGKEKTVKVIILPTEKESTIHFTNDTEVLTYVDTKCLLSYAEPQALYLISDDEIKKGDWYLYYMDGVKDPELMQCQDDDEAKRCNSHPLIKPASKKIEASTDLSSGVEKCTFCNGIGDISSSMEYDKDCPVCKGLGYKKTAPMPQIPESFVREYVSVDGRIEEVKIEMELRNKTISMPKKLYYDVKATPDNFVIIKPIENNQSKENNLIAVAEKVYKECKAILLESDEKAKSGDLFINGMFNICQYSNYDKPNRMYNSQHIYIVSDDKIKEGDWCWNQYKGNSEICIGRVGKDRHKSMIKIIATTDPSLIYTTENLINIPLPKLSETFIKEFIAKQGRVNETWVEYESWISNGLANKIGETITVPKVASDNTIIIRLNKDSWNKEEVLNLMSKTADEVRKNGFGGYSAARNVAQKIFNENIYSR